MKQAGFSLVEMMVALGVSALVLIAATDGTVWSLKESTYLRQQENTQAFILEEQKRFIDDSLLKKTIQSLPEDEFLSSCLLSPCQKDCREKDYWHATEWGRIYLNQVITDEGKKHFGSAFRNTEEGLFEQCPLLPPDADNPDYHFNPECQHRARAEWRSGGGDTLLLRIHYSNPSQNIFRQVMHRLSIAKDPRTGTCQKAAAVSCSGSNIFITRVNLKKEEFECSLIQPQGEL